MDPNANIEEQRRLCDKMIGDEYEVDADDAMRLVELVQALDGWLRNRGALPRTWNHSYDRAVYEAQQREKEKKG